MIGMLDCAPLIIVSDVCLTIQAPLAEWLRRWSRKPEILGPISGRAHFSFSLYYLPISKQLKSNIYLHRIQCMPIFSVLSLCFKLQLVITLLFLLKALLLYLSPPIKFLKKIKNQC